MELDEIAKELGYTDKAHLEQNIEAYGAPLDKWWDVMQKVVNKLPLHGVSDSVCPICKAPFKKGKDTVIIAHMIVGIQIFRVNCR